MALAPSTAAAPRARAPKAVREAVAEAANVLARRAATVTAGATKRGAVRLLAAITPRNATEEKREAIVLCCLVGGVGLFGGVLGWLVVWLVVSGGGWRARVLCSCRILTLTDIDLYIFKIAILPIKGVGEPHLPSWFVCWVASFGLLDTTGTPQNKRQPWGVPPLRM